jgi:hypothetical protein
MRPESGAMSTVGAAEAGKSSQKACKRDGGEFELHVDRDR